MGPGGSRPRRRGRRRGCRPAPPPPLDRPTGGSGRTRPTSCAALACPSRPDTVRTSTPEASKRVAAKWRRSWKRTPSMPSCAQNREKASVIRPGFHGAIQSGSSENTNASSDKAMSNSAARSSIAVLCRPRRSTVPASSASRRAWWVLVSFSITSRPTWTAERSTSTWAPTRSTADQRSTISSPRRAPVTAATWKNTPSSGRRDCFAASMSRITSSGDGGFNDVRRTAGGLARSAAFVPTHSQRTAWLSALTDHGMHLTNRRWAQPLVGESTVEAVEVLGRQLGDLHLAEGRNDPPGSESSVFGSRLWRQRPAHVLEPSIEQLGRGGERPRDTTSWLSAFSASRLVPLNPRRLEIGDQ